MTSSTTRPNELKSDAKNVVQHAKRDLSGTLQDVTGDVTYIANKAGKEVRHYVDAANDYIDNAKNEITYATDMVTKEVRNNPLRSALLALGAGFILGALFRR
jgi:ElaB/YqjD/DUF883 family membrane-anchored ribosome-binding protein